MQVEKQFRLVNNFHLFWSSEHEKSFFILAFIHGIASSILFVPECAISVFCNYCLSCTYFWVTAIQRGGLLTGMLYQFL